MRFAGILATALIGLVALSPAGCGNNGGESSSDSDPVAQTGNEGATTSAESSGQDCPLTEEQVSDAAGETLPKFPGSFGETICSFGGVGADGEVASTSQLTVSTEIPGNQGAGEAPPLAQEQGAVSMPEWGPGGFYSVSSSGATLISAKVGDFQLLGSVAEGSKVDPEAMIIALGNDLAPG